jgi:hypothetical protein
MLFQPDLFSISRPEWVKVSEDSLSTLDNVLTRLPKWFLPQEAFPEQSGALGINSSNFRLYTSKGVFLLKRWSDQTAHQDIENTLAIMKWLASCYLPVPVPVDLYKGSFTLKSNSATWSVFPFIEGDYFSGVGDELGLAAEITGRIMQTLSFLPKSLMPNVAPIPMTNSDGKILQKFNECSGDWERMLGKEQTELLAEWWPILMEEWHTLNSINLVAGPIQASHFDLHPHNILMREGRIAAILDFEACKVMPIGFALGFAAMKQCRQALVASTLPDNLRSIGSHYVARLVKACPDAHKIVANFGNLAVAETLRRICIILRLNLESGEKKWNKVLPIQLNHLGEARALFG